MTDAVFSKLKKWVCNVLGDVEISPMLPVSGNQNDIVVTLYLLSLEESSATGVRPVKNNLQLSSLYLVRVCGEIHKANAAIATLAFSAMGSEDMEPAFNTVSHSDWKAFGLAPGPAFILKVPLNYRLSEKEVSIVKKPMVLKNTPVE